MPDSSADRDPLERLAEEFVTRVRRGERPSVTEYAGRHPELAEQVRDLFPALVEMEQLKPVTADHTGAFTPQAEPSDPDRVGEFRILRRVGHGGMGVVYEAVQESLGRHVALKILPPEALLDPRRLERFRREARAAARLHHTNIVPVFGVGEADGRHFYAMQFIDGHPLDAVIAEVRRLKEKSAVLPPSPPPVSEVAAALWTGTLARTVSHADPGDDTAEHNAPAPPAPGPSSAASPPALSGSISEGGRHYWEAVARIGAQVADGLAHAHGQGILHRDVKPANLLLDPYGTVWVTDFGLAKASDADDLTHAGDVIGTLRYMAPERFDGPGDSRADVYALGLTLYELLTLRPAFVAENRARLVEQAIAASPPKPRGINPQIPRDLETIVLKAIARDPAMRYQRAAELADDLRRFVEDRPIRARRASSAEQAWRWCRRNPAVASLLAAVVVVFAAGAAVSAYFAAEEGKRAKEAADNANEATRKSILAFEREADAKRERDRANDEAKKVRAEEAKVRAERDRFAVLLHVSQINQAQAALDDNRNSRVVQLLADTTPKTAEEPDLRGWEWHYLARLIRGPVIAEFRGEGGPPHHFGMTADGRVLRGRAEAGGVVLELWDARTGGAVARAPKAGVITLAKPPRVALSPDGRFVAAATAEAPEKEGGPPRELVRLWEFETGAELAGPTDTVPDSFTLDPGGTGMTWTALAPPRECEDGLPSRILCRWDRASGRVTRTPFPRLPKPGPDPPAPGEAPREPSVGFSGGERPQLAPDGRTLYRVTYYGEFRDEKTPADDPARDDPRAPSVVKLEGWDLTVAPPRNPWPTIVLGRDRLGMEAAFSPSCTTVAAADEREVVVCRLADGQVLWRTPHGRSGRLFGVSDDGRRVAFQAPWPGEQLTVLEQDLTAPEKDRTAKPAELVFRCSWGQPTLSGDGKTVLLTTQGGRVQILDVTRDPALAAPGEAGRLAVVRPGRGHPAANPCVVLGPDGREVGRLEAPPAQRQVFARLAADDRRLLTNRPPPGLEFGGGDDPDENPEDPNEWDLYDVTAPGVPRRVAGGRGKAVAPPGTPWVVTTTRTGVAWFEAKNIRYLNEIISVTVRDGLSGEPVHEVTVPPGRERAGPPVFASGGDRYAVVTRPARRAGPDGSPVHPAGPVTLRVREVASGREVWSVNLTERGENAPFSGSVFFSPDGGRVFVAYHDEYGANHQPRSLRVWVGRSADGTHERTLRIPAEQPDTGSAPYVLGVAADGRLLVNSGDTVIVRDGWRVGGEVQVWDPDTGERTHRLPGHDGRVVWADVSPDRRRLFVLVGVEGPARLHVWDLTVGRELLILPVPWDDPALGPENPRGVWFDGRRVLVPGSKGVRVFDGSPTGR